MKENSEPSDKLKMIRRQFMHRFQENRIEKINFNSTEVNSRSLEVKEYFLDMGILINSNEEFDDDFNDKILTPEPIMSFFDVIGKIHQWAISSSESEFQAVQTDDQILILIFSWSIQQNSEKSNIHFYADTCL